MKYLFLGLLAVGASACGPRVSVGDLAGDALHGTAGSSGVGGTASAPQAGGGVSSGNTGGDTGGTNTECAEMLNQPVAIQANCPDAMPTQGDSCADAVENGICVWQLRGASDSHGYRAMGCYRGLQGKVWWGEDYTSPGTGSAEDVECPKQAPQLGAACTSQNVKTCIYPTAYCECGPNLPNQWLCTGSESLAGNVSPPVEQKRLCAPNLNESDLVKDLGAKQGALWCTWYASISGILDGNPVESSHKDSPGVADSYNYRTLSTPEMTVCMADLPISMCEQNLLTQACTATVAELDDCVESIRGGWVGHGCAPLLNNPTCSGVIVQPFTDKGPQGSKCSVPLK